MKVYTRKSLTLKMRGIICVFVMCERRMERERENICGS